MSRQVVKASANRGVMRGPGDQGDSYSDRLLKLIPAETVAVYLFVQGILQSALKGEEAQLQAWQWATFVVLLAGNLLYLWKFHGIKDWLQYLILTLAFAVWVFALGGPFAFLGFYRPFMGSLVMVLFTFFAPVFYKGVEVSA